MASKRHSNVICAKNHFRPDKIFNGTLLQCILAWNYLSVRIDCVRRSFLWSISSSDTLTRYILAQGHSIRFGLHRSHLYNRFDRIRRSFPIQIEFKASQVPHTCQMNRYQMHIVLRKKYKLDFLNKKHNSNHTLIKFYCVFICFHLEALLSVKNEIRISISWMSEQMKFTHFLHGISS